MKIVKHIIGKEQIGKQPICFSQEKTSKQISKSMPLEEQNKKNGPVLLTDMQTNEISEQKNYTESEQYQGYILVPQNNLAMQRKIHGINN